MYAQYTRWAIAGLGVALAAAFVLIRPPAPLYWDVLVWLGKARLAAGSLESLRAATLDAHAVIPPGYPLYWPTAVGWLGAHHGDAASLVVAARLLVGATVILYIGAFGGRARRPGWAWGVAAAAVVSAPFVFVHLRSVYVDLPVGLVAGALAAVLVAPARREAAGVAFALGGVLGSIKDEGLVHVFAIAGVALVVALRSRDPKSARAPLAACIGAAIPFVAWRVLLAGHGAVDEDHGLGWPDFATALPLARVWAAHALDIRSWGLFWPLAAGAALAESTRRDARGAIARRLAAMLALDAVAIFVGVMACPARVHEFARGGTLVGRLLVQHAPLATLLFAEIAETRFASARWRARRFASA
jgi:hypothetical protein